MLQIDGGRPLEDWEFTERFIGARGPGGQHVNKVATAVELRFEAERSPNLPADVKRRLRRLAGRRWTQEGAVLIRADDTRSQARNRELARARLAALVAEAWRRPTRRIATRPTRASVRRRLDNKARAARLKSTRSRPSGDD